MAPTRVNDDPMSTQSRKRSPDVQEDDGPGAKRKRVTPSTVILRTEYTDRLTHSPTLATPEELARRGLRRSIALTLQKVGFESASPDAMESFVSLTETCRHQFRGRTKLLASNPCCLQIFLHLSTTLEKSQMLLDEHTLSREISNTV